MKFERKDVEKYAARDLGNGSWEIDLPRHDLYCATFLEGTYAVEAREEGEARAKILNQRTKEAVPGFDQQNVNHYVVFQHNKLDRGVVDLKKLGRMTDSEFNEEFDRIMILEAEEQRRLTG